MGLASRPRSRSAAGVSADAVSVSSPHPVPDWDVRPVPVIEACRAWELTGLRQLCGVRRAARRYLAEAGEGEDTVEQTILVLDELASNALRHGSLPARLVLGEHPDGWLVVATDAARDRLPVPAVDRPAERGGMGLYVVADLSTTHGTQRDADSKHVWAIFPRT